MENFTYYNNLIIKELLTIFLMKKKDCLSNGVNIITDLTWVMMMTVAI